ncbi:MAG: protein phosphatase 2C domain-containing protein [Clostridium sp.]|nr:protein phosphatase 2C domain-containing protein [Clostridium sp.]MCM1207700.1 protein phosphatase 2C domain-containing protein [Ruminococcus sp.]
MSVEYGIMSWIGMRDEQQDSVEVYSFNDFTIAVVCDGMGGSNGGAVASDLAAKHFVEYTREAYPMRNIWLCLKSIAMEIDKEVYDLRGNKGERLGAGTTLAGIIIDENELHWLSIGDSRIYIERNGMVASVTRKHNYQLYLDEQLRLGQISREAYERNLEKAEYLISFVGYGNVSLMDINTDVFKLLENDKILVCSDGLYRSMPEEQIVEILTKEQSAERIANIFLGVLKDKNSPYQDNASAIVIKYLKDAEKTTKLR